MTLGLVARTLWLSAHSVLLDEATVAIGARDIIQNHTNMWDAMSNAPFVWMIAHLLGMTGLASDFLLRLPSAITGTASIAMVYALAERLFNKKIAVASAFLFALHPFAVAFSRVLFADPFQVFFVLLGCYGFDKLATNAWRETPRKWMLLLYLCLIWGLAFIMKYNAIVPGVLWLVSGVVSRRYKIVPTIAAFIAMALGPFLTLLIWPYDESVWLLAFMGKAGSYNFVYAMDYYLDRLHLVFFGITEIMFVAALVVAWLLYRKGRKTDLSTNNEQTSASVGKAKSILHLTLFLLLETATLIMLGRMFDRYLLVLVPFGCILIIALLVACTSLMRLNPYRWMFTFWDAKDGKVPRSWVIEIALFYGVIGPVMWFFGKGAYESYSDYFAYLRNDVDYASMAHTVLRMEQKNPSVNDSARRAFWLVPEPIAAYYLGYTQRYSRATLPNLDGPTANQNFFEFASVPYAEDWKGDKVLAIRRLAREWGLARILASPHRFLDQAKSVADSARNMPPLLVADYMTSDFIHPGDLLIMQSGLLDLQGEPILEDIANESGPPFIPSLPLNRFAVYRVYRPDGLAPVTDTTLERVKAGAWILVRK
jgi:4-amino-4-deoxy-L-arabinose transferase-like glycosyltransferase